MQATVLIFPDLNTGNNTYKAVQQVTPNPKPTRHLLQQVALTQSFKLSLLLHLEESGNSSGFRVNPKTLNPRLF
jgi:hypothetical protein